MFFIVRDHQYLPATRLTFRNFMQNGMDGHRATIGDWDTHLTTLFPEIRLKRIVEVRGTDAVSREMICALPALWKGILYDAGARDAVWSLVGGASAHDRDDGLVDVARRGLAADFAGRPVLELARELVAISEAGLAAMIARGEADVSETGFLDPLHAVIERGLSPGEQTLESWRGEWNGSMDRLIASAKY
jgi:glutamate--cysteine ligase